MNDLEKLFFENSGRLIHKWNHYLEIYDKHFSRFRGKDVNVLEFGVFQGGSLQMWRQYFGPKSKLFGVDINPHCMKFEEEQIKIFIGDQEDRGFLKSLAEKIGRIDILIDDGGHKMTQQIYTFKELFPMIDENGVYVCEDLHSSYWRGYGGGYKKRGTFIEYSKKLIDQLNAWHIEKKNKKIVNEFTKSVHSLHYYDSMFVIEKRSIEKPYHMKTGTPEIPEFIPQRTILQRVRRLIEQEFGRLTGYYK